MERNLHVPRNLLLPHIVYYPHLPPISTAKAEPGAVYSLAAADDWTWPNEAGLPPCVTWVAYRYGRCARWAWAWTWLSSWSLLIAGVMPVNTATAAAPAANITFNAPHRSRQSHTHTPRRSHPPPSIPLPV
ncbi:hypothetical protein An09g03590, partial [Aspergillus niger]|uniref:Uncharacterized protein n=2 Tax=Aspergillus niger TaxID=5061 RepID=A0AAJ8C188_ASPNG